MAEDDGIVGLVALGAGGFHGFCNAQNIPLEGWLENTLNIGPAILFGMRGIGLAKEYNVSTTKMVAGKTFGGAVATLIGYGIGYGVGNLIK